MTDRKLTCAACKSAITKGDIAGSDLEFGGELKATNQPKYTADADTDLVATVGTLDEYTHMVRTSGNQSKTGALTFKSNAASTNIALQALSGGIGNAGTNTPRIGFYGTNQETHSDELFGFIGCIVNADGTTGIFIRVKNSNGSEKTILLGKGDVIE